MWGRIVILFYVLVFMAFLVAVILQTWPRCGLCGRRLWPWQRKEKAVWWGKKGIKWVHHRCFLKP